MQEVWCLILVSLAPVHGSQYPVETSVKGKLVHATETMYTVDFSEYATAKGYYGNWKQLLTLPSHMCILYK
jgi:hypothetical protein